MKKLKKSQISGSNADNSCIYRHLELVYGQETPRKSTCTLDDDFSKGSTISLTGENKEEQRTQVNRDFQSHSSISKQGRSKRKKWGSKNPDTCDIILQKIEKRLDNEYEFEGIGKNFANKLRSLPRETRIQTEKIINDVLYYAELGKININTTYSLRQPATQEKTSETPSELNIKEFCEKVSEFK